MTVFVSGGCKNGKSTVAQNIAVQLADGKKRYYVATMIPYDDEDRARVRRHLSEREGLGFETLEVGRDIYSCLKKAEKNATFLVDSVTALLLNEMFLSDDNAMNAEADPNAPERCKSGLIAFAQTVKNAVFVSDWLYSDAARYDAFTENFRSALASVDRALAAECETVLELCAGNITVFKGEMPN